MHLLSRQIALTLESLQKTILTAFYPGWLLIQHPGTYSVDPGVEGQLFLADLLFAATGFQFRADGLFHAHRATPVDEGQRTGERAGWLQTIVCREGKSAAGPR